MSLLLLLTRLTRAGRENVYFNTTNTAFPFVILFLRLLCGRGLWFLDMHDDLLYDETGCRRLRAALAVKLQNWTSDIVVRSAESLHELFPRSVAFGNASQLKRVERSVIDYRSVLILASLDARFDFQFMAATADACPSTNFHIYGQVSRANPYIRSLVEQLCQSRQNVIYHGSYELADLEKLLIRYSVSLAPYRTNSRLTRYLDPLRFYHCLNSGMELIATGIPQAEQMQESLHLVRTAHDVQAVLEDLEGHPELRRNSSSNYQPQTWSDKADRLIDIALQGLATRNGGKKDVAGLIRTAR